MALPDWYRNEAATMAEVARRDVFFVMGCQKSGTTWVATLLDTHPAVCCRGEGHLSDVIGPMLEQLVRLYNEDERTTRTIGQDALLTGVRVLGDHVLGQYLADRPDAEAVRWLGDRTPEAAIGMPALGALYPGAKFIQVIRDGRDGAVSGWAHLKRTGKADRFSSFAEYAGYFARGHWVPYVRRARAAAAKLPEGRYHEVRYEALHADPQRETRGLLGFLGAEADEAQVTACVTRASFGAVTGGRAPGEEDPSSHCRKGIVGDWRNHFDAEAERRFLAEAEPLLQELGYLETAPV